MNWSHLRIPVLRLSRDTWNSTFNIVAGNCNCSTKLEKQFYHPNSKKGSKNDVSHFRGIAWITCLDWITIPELLDKIFSRKVSTIYIHLHQIIPNQQQTCLKSHNLYISNNVRNFRSSLSTSITLKYLTLLIFQYWLQNLPNYPCTPCIWQLGPSSPTGSTN